MNIENVKQYVLYPQLNQKLCEQYSLFKLGDVAITHNFAQECARFIQNNITNDKRRFALFGANKAPVTKYCKKNSLLLAEQIAEILDIPLLIGEYTYTYTDSSFYDTSKDRKSAIHQPILKNKEKLKEENYHIIMVDDSIVSGNSLRVSLNEINQITSDVSFFSIIKLDPQTENEADINDYVFTSKTYDLLPEIINQDNYIFTSHMMRTIHKLSQDEVKKLMAAIDDSKKELLHKAFEIYFDKQLII